MVALENQLIVYTPKKNVKKIILTVLLLMLIGIVIFLIAAFSSASIFLKNKWNETEYVNLQTTNSNLVF